MAGRDNDFFGFQRALVENEVRKRAAEMKQAGFQGDSPMRGLHPRETGIRHPNPGLSQEPLTFGDDPPGLFSNEEPLPPDLGNNRFPLEPYIERGPLETQDDLPNGPMSGQGRVRGKVPVEMQSFIAARLIEQMQKKYNLRVEEIPLGIVSNDLRPYLNEEDYASLEMLLPSFGNNQDTIKQFLLNSAVRNMMDKSNMFRNERMREPI